MNLLNRLYPLKKCDGNPKKVCLYYHIGECLGYCEKKIIAEKQIQMEKDILSFLNGNDKILTDKMQEKINTYSETLNFEMALELKKELEQVFPGTDIYVDHLSLSVSCHIGPGSLAIACAKKAI